MTLAILGDVCHAAFQNVTRSGVMDRLAQQLNLPSVNGEQPCQRVDQFRLPVALYSCNPQHLTFFDIEGHAIDS